MWCAHKPHAPLPLPRTLSLCVLMSSVTHATCGAVSRTASATAITASPLGQRSESSSEEVRSPTCFAPGLVRGNSSCKRFGQDT